MLKIIKKHANTRTHAPTTHPPKPTHPQLTQPTNPPPPDTHTQNIPRSTSKMYPLESSSGTDITLKSRIHP